MKIPIARRAGVWSALGVAALVLPAEVSAQAPAELEAVVAAYHEALAAGDSVAALALLADDVVILEGGGLETKEQYRSGHLAGDMRFAQAVPRERGAMSVEVVGDVGWAWSTSVTTGRMGDREIDAQGAELMVLAFEEGAWRIKAIHWSSRAR